MSTLVRGIVQGVGFGLAVATSELGVNFVGVMRRRFGGNPEFALEVTVLEVGLAAVIGLAAAPLLRLRAGRALHLVAIGACWFALTEWVQLDSPLFSALGRVPPVAATLLALLGLALARWRPVAPWVVVGLLWLLAVAAPPVYLHVTTPPVAPVAELAPARADAPDVVVVVLDTVRAGNVASYGYERETSPELDAIAAEGALFVDATSPSTWSLPSHASLFTGRYPSSHGAHAEHHYLDGRFPTLAEILQRSGYETFCFTANAWISDGLGLTRGFAVHEQGSGGGGMGFSFIHRLLDRLGLQEADKGGGAIAGLFEDWARERDSERPAFVFLNFIEAHFPYHMLPHEHLRTFTDLGYGRLRAISMSLMGQQFGGPGLALDEALGPTRDMYDGGVAYSSRLVGRVVDALRERGTLDQTVVVVLADHGEILGEREGYFGHGPTLYQEAIEVPLVVRYPPRIAAGTRVETPVSTLGVLASVLDLAGLPPSPTAQVGSLVPLAEGRAGASPGPILSELHESASMSGEIHREDPQFHSDRRYRMLREGPLKLVTSSTGQELLYDLESDPEESRDLANERPRDLALMKRRMDGVRAELGLPALDAELAVGDDAPELDEATRERLRALGYVE